MNTVETSTIVCPDNKTDECAKFIIDDGTFVYTLSDVMMVGRKYTFSCWTKSEADGMIVVSGSATETSTEWQYFAHTFTSDNTDLSIGFATAGAYYIYHPKLEIGTIATDWSPAPEDMPTNDDLDGLNEEIQVVTKSLSDFKVEANQIYATVGSVTTKIKDSADLLSADIAEISKAVSSRMSDEDIVYEITTRINDGVTKVDTKTGFVFNSDGMTVDKSGATTKTVISENGMTVYQKIGDATAEVLTANDNGVDAKNLEATTYLIIGGRSRFENFGTNRTGCFWIGGG